MLLTPHSKNKSLCLLSSHDPEDWESCDHWQEARIKLRNWESSGDALLCCCLVAWLDHKKTELQFCPIFLLYNHKLSKLNTKRMNVYHHNFSFKSENSNVLYSNSLLFWKLIWTIQYTHNIFSQYSEKYVALTEQASESFQTEFAWFRHSNLSGNNILEKICGGSCSLGTKLTYHLTISPPVTKSSAALISYQCWSHK